MQDQFVNTTRFLREASSSEGGKFSDNSADGRFQHLFRRFFQHHCGGLFKGPRGCSCSCVDVNQRVTRVVERRACW